MLDKTKYKTPFLLLAFGILFSLASAIANIDSDEIWFSRSGAILSFVSVVVQFQLSNLRKSEIEFLFKSGKTLKDKFTNIQSKNLTYEVLSAASGITGLAGTLIWGYGDLLF